jgi:RNA polymerase sigma factor (sigma-70 family)
MPRAETPDADLIALIAAGDDEAFGRIYRRYLPLVLRWCLRETGNRELAADLAAEVFAAALLASRRYKPEAGGVAAWLLGIARNKLRESRRRKRVEDSSRRRLGLEPVALNDADIERVDEIASLTPGLVGLLEALPAEQREAITERVIHERSYEEIAEQLSCSTSVARQRVSRGLRTLRSELER